MNVACNSPDTVSRRAPISLELQRLRTLLKVHSIELHAKLLRARAACVPRRARGPVRDVPADDCAIKRGELHATFMENSPGGSHALPLIAPPVAHPLAQPVARQWPGTAAWHGEYRRRKRPAQAPPRQIKEPRTDSQFNNHLQHQFSCTNKPKSHHTTNMLSLNPIVSKGHRP